MREISLDTETTGLSFADGDKITEIGCVEIIDKKITGKTFHAYINPQREVGEKAAEISGLTYDFLKKFKTFKETYQEFLDFVKDDRLVIHNAPFDIGFLNFELGEVGVSGFKLDETIDTLVMAKEKYPGSPSTLDALCRRFSVDSTMRIKHGALIDAELLAQVYINMSVELTQKDIFGAIQVNTDNNENFDEKIYIKDRYFFPSETELKLHSEFIAKIKNSVWDNFN